MQYGRPFALLTALSAFSCGGGAWKLTSYPIPTCQQSDPVVDKATSPSFDKSGPTGVWTSLGFPSVASLVACGPVPSNRARFRAGPLGVVYEEQISERGKLASLGGTYWMGAYDVEPFDCRLDTSLAKGATGSLLSPPQGPAKYFSALVGAGGDARTRVELCVGAPRCVDHPETAFYGSALLGMQRVTWDLAALGFAGQPVQLRVVIADGAEAGTGTGFLLVDDLRATDAPPPAQPPRLWGFVDLHAHLFNSIGSGGRTLHGAISADPLPGDAKLDPAGRKLALMERALGRSCVDDHGVGGYTFSTEPLGHGTEGFPYFAGWPKFGSIAHQQAYVDWIERAYRGGLRLVQMDVGNNTTYAASYEQMNGGKVPPLRVREPGDSVYAKSADEDIVRHKELAELKRFVAPGGPAADWAAVAHGPAEARRIAESGKLVIVPGLESDNPGVEDDRALYLASKTPPREARVVVRGYLQKLWDEGIRHVFPVHVMPNVFGDPAVYDRTIYCAAIAEQGELQPLANGMSFDIRYHVDKDPGHLPGVGFFVDYLSTSVLDPLPRSHAVLDRSRAYPSLDVADCYRLDISDSRYFSAHALARHNGLQSTRAAGGLTMIGALFVEESMRLGMMIDLTHMSERARGETLAIAQQLKYPLMIGHSNFRELAFGNHETAKSCEYKPTSVVFDASSAEARERTAAAYGTSDVLKVPYEYSVRRAEVEAVRDLGGIVGMPFEINGVGVKWRSSVDLDCDGSSKSYAQEFLYARSIMKGRGIGFGTDVNGFSPMPAPRFGEDACAGAKLDNVRGKNGNRAGMQTQSDCSRVAYLQRPTKVLYRADGAHADHRMLPSLVGGYRAFTVNEDGVAHYGMLPDLLQDVVNDGVTVAEMATMFSGLEDYIEMWEAVEVAASRVRALDLDSEIDLDLLLHPGHH